MATVTSKYIPSGFTLSYTEAVKIQEEQLAFYCERLTPEGAKLLREYIKGKTLPCPGDPDKPMDICDVNDLVPRGTSFESEEAMSIKLNNRKNGDQNNVN